MMVSLILRCRDGHEQEIKLEGDIAWAEQLAGIMDGSSSLYVVPVPEERPIGFPHTHWCSHTTPPYGNPCGKRFTATVIPHEPKQTTDEVTNAE